MDISVIAPIIQFRLAVAEQLGADTAKIMEQAQILPEDLVDPEKRVSLTQECKVWQGILQETGREDIGLLCGERLPIRVASMIGYVMMNAPNIAIALQKMCSYQKLIGNSMGMEYKLQQGMYQVSVVLWTDWVPELRYTMDVIMASIYSWTLNNTEHRVVPTAVSFSYPKPANHLDYDKMFAPATVKWDSAYSYCAYPAAAMSSPVISSNPALFEQFDQMAKKIYSQFEAPDSFAAAVRKIIVELLDGSVPTLDIVAQKLRVSKRSLQSKLKMEEQSFQQILNKVRQELAEHYLRDRQISKSEIAYLLGFSEVAVFSRNFKKWTNLTPSEFQLSALG